MGTVLNSVSIVSISQGRRLLLGFDKRSLVFVGYWPRQSAVVVAHQGTDPHEMYVALIPNTRSYPLSRHPDYRRGPRRVCT